MCENQLQIFVMNINKFPPCFNGSTTHLQNIEGVLKRNKVIVTWNDSLWWQTKTVFNSLL